jgi:hypothetical protein
MIILQKEVEIPLTGAYIINNQNDTNRRRRRKQESKEIGNIIQNEIAHPLVRKTLHPFIHPFIHSSIHPSKENGLNHGKGLVFCIRLTSDYLLNLCRYLVSQAIPLFVTRNWSSPYRNWFDVYSVVFSIGFDSTIKQ